jgi:hypothetical protein
MPGSNTTVHRIRLRGPWALEPTDAGDMPERTVRLPLQWAELVDFGARRVRLSRRFHRPTNLGPNDQVSVVVHDLPAGAQVGLNGTILEQQIPPPTKESVFGTPQLEPTNLLSVEFDVSTRSAAGDGTWGEVALLISSP